MKRKVIKYGYFCQNCRKELELDDQVFFVESASGNYFCSEPCIQEFFGPVAQFYFQQLVKIRDSHDIPTTDFEKYEKYASLCMETPQEVWVDEGESGEQYFIFISEYSDAGGSFWYVAMTFCLEGEPTFVLLSFPTRDRALVQGFRRGRPVDKRIEEGDSKPPVEQGLENSLLQPSLDERGIALMEEMLKNRSRSDIKPADFEEHSYLLEETIENPDEAWEMDAQDHKDALLTLITEHGEKLHYVVICALDKGDESQATWRVLYHFPTGDSGLVQRYRRGSQRDASASELNIIH